MTQKELMMRRYMMGGKKEKPYDSRVEWVQVTSGNVYWDTDASLTTAADAVFTTRVNSAGGLTSFLIAPKQYDTNAAGGFYDNTAFFVRYTGINGGYTYYSFKVNGVTVEAYIRFVNGYDVTLFKWVNNIASGTGLTSAAGTALAETISIGPLRIGSSKFRCTSKFYWLKIQSGTDITHNIYPVRKGTKCYMYDEVTEKMFAANNNENYYTMGPDIAG